MAEVKNKKKLATSAIALTTAAALLLGGTLAWQSISQEATNIVTAAVNPGGRLHDDFDGSNDKNIYVENFGNQNIYARVKLSEYLEIGPDAGNLATDGTSKRAENLENGAIEVLAGADIDDKDTYGTYYYGEENISDGYWTKDWEGQTKYIPTFNKDQDSLEADLNGTYEYVDETTGESKPYGDFVDYNAAAADYSETEYEWFDADTDDTSNEHVNPDSIDAGSHSISETEVEHTLADSIDGTVISMADYNNLSDDEKAALQAWVYDTDGWAYWSQAIAPETSTGLLLDSITDLGLIDEDYYYAIHVTGQFITAGDLGNVDGTGFYADENEVPSADALALLASIGVKTDDSTTDDEETDDPYGFSHMLFSPNSEETKSITFTNSGYAQPGDTVVFGVVAYYNNGEVIEINSDNTSWSISAAEGVLADGTTIENGVITISGDQAHASVLEFTATYTDANGATYDKTGHILVNKTDKTTLTVTVEEADTYYTGISYQVTATATDADGASLPMAWTYDIYAANESQMEELNASFAGDSFTADVAGKYTINVWAEYMWSKYATTNVTVENPDSDETSAYAISISDTAIIGADDTTGITLSLTAAGTEVTDNVTWSVSSENAVVEEGYIKAAGTVTMSAPIEKYTVTAFVGDTEVATADVYMYDNTYHTMMSRENNILTLESGNTYCLFEPAATTYPAGMEISGCVWKFGDDVNTIYYYSGEASISYQGIAEMIENYITTGEVSQTGIDITTCPHFEAYSE